MNFTIMELVKSNIAKINKIDNTPDSQSLKYMLELIKYCLQPIRDKLGKPMIITSGYRCKELNKKVGGVSTSQHCKGQAVDFYVKDMTIQQIVDFIKKSGVEFDQLINEYNKWVHISFVKGKNRKQVLKYG